MRTLLAVALGISAMFPSAQAQDLQKAQSQADAAQHAGPGVVAETGDSKRRVRKSEPLSERDQLAIAALEGLIAAPAERAFPLIQRVLTGTQHSDQVKARALFVLSQMDTPQAQALLVQTAKSGSGELRGEAIRMIGIGGDAAAINSLREIYASGDKAVQREVLNAYLIAGRKDEVLKITIAAKSDAEAEAGIQMLATMGALAELRQLGDRGKPLKGLVQAYAIAGDLESLNKIANGPGDLRVRTEAVQSIGIVGGDKAKQALRELYRNPDAQIKDAALQGLLIADDEKGLLELYRLSTNPADKRELLRTLSVMGGDAAIEAIDAALQGGAK